MYKFYIFLYLNLTTFPYPNPYHYPYNYHYHYQVLAVREKTLDANDPNLLAALNNLAVVHKVLLALALTSTLTSTLILTDEWPNTNNKLIIVNTANN